MENPYRCIPDLCLMAAVYIVFILPRLKKQTKTALFWKTMLYLSFTMIIGVTLMPVILNLPNLFIHKFSRYNFNPFVDLLNGYGTPVTEICLNILLFIPFGFLYAKAMHAGFPQTVLAGASLSMAVEILQPLISFVRVFDITDVITNTIGTALGAGLYLLIHSVHKHRSADKLTDN